MNNEFFRAIQSDDVVLVKAKLLETPSWANHGTWDKGVLRFPLDIAAEAGSKDTALLLLENGAAFYSGSGQMGGWDSISRAIENEHTDLAIELHQRCTAWRAKKSYNKTIPTSSGEYRSKGKNYVKQATEKNNVALLSYLLKSGAHPDGFSDPALLSKHMGRPQTLTPLESALRSENAEVGTLLIQYGATIPFEPTLKKSSSKKLSLLWDWSTDEIRKDLAPKIFKAAVGSSSACLNWVCKNISPFITISQRDDLIHQAFSSKESGYLSPAHIQNFIKKANHWKPSLESLEIWSKDRYVLTTTYAQSDSWWIFSKWLEEKNHPDPYPLFDAISWWNRLGPRRPADHDFYHALREKAPRAWSGFCLHETNSFENLYHILMSVDIAKIDFNKAIENTQKWLKAWIETRSSIEEFDDESLSSLYYRLSTKAKNPNENISNLEQLTYRSRVLPAIFQHISDKKYLDYEINDLIVFHSVGLNSGLLFPVLKELSIQGWTPNGESFKALAKSFDQSQQSPSAYQCVDDLLLLFLENGLSVNQVKWSEFGSKINSEIDFPKAWTFQSRAHLQSTLNPAIAPTRALRL